MNLGTGSSCPMSKRLEFMQEVHKPEAVPVVLEEYMQSMLQPILRHNIYILSIYLLYQLHACYKDFKSLPNSSFHS